MQETWNGSAVVTTDSEWSLDLRDPAKASVTSGAPPDGDSPDLTLTISDANFEKLVAGKLGPQQVSLPPEQHVPEIPSRVRQAVTDTHDSKGCSIQQSVHRHEPSVARDFSQHECFGLSCRRSCCES